MSSSGSVTVQQLRLIGWRDPERPATHKDGMTHEFRIKLSEAPLSPWKREFTMLCRDQRPSASVEQDVVILTCELPEVESAIERIKQRVQATNETLIRLERESDERVARQARISEDQEQRVLAAVKNIRFDDV